MFNITYLKEYFLRIEILEEVIVVRPLRHDFCDLIRKQEANANEKKIVTRMRLFGTFSKSAGEFF